MSLKNINQNVTMAESAWVGLDNLCARMRRLDRDDVLRDPRLRTQGHGFLWDFYSAMGSNDRLRGDQLEQVILNMVQYLSYRTLSREPVVDVTHQFKVFLPLIFFAVKFHT